jgi:hypothetical protein
MTRALGGSSLRDRDWSIDRLRLLEDRVSDVLRELKEIRSLLEGRRLPPAAAEPANPGDDRITTPPQANV